MQAVKEKLSDMKTMRKAKAEAKDEEKAEKELAQARVEIAHEVRMAKEAEAAMDLHVAKAAEKVDREIAKHEAMHPSLSTASNMGSTPNPSYDHNPGHLGSTTDMAMGMGYTTNTPGAPPSNNIL